jgi:hypothetical protein
MLMVISSDEQWLYRQGLVGDDYDAKRLQKF